MGKSDFRVRNVYCPVCGREADPYGGVCFYCGTPFDISYEADYTDSFSLGCALVLFCFITILIFVFLINKLL